MDAPKTYTAQTLAKAAGVHIKTFKRHLKANAFRLKQAQRREPGVGVYYVNTPKIEEYIDVCNKMPKRRKPQ